MTCNLRWDEIRNEFLFNGKSAKSKFEQFKDGVLNKQIFGRFITNVQTLIKM